MNVAAQWFSAPKLRRIPKAEAVAVVGQAANRRVVRQRFPEGAPGGG